MSWWDWQEARASSGPPCRGRPARCPATSPTRRWPTSTPTPPGDLVVWAQEHLVSAGYPIQVSGDYGYHTLLDVEAFQTAHGLSADGIIGPETWAALLRYRMPA